MSPWKGTKRTSTVIPVMQAQLRCPQRRYIIKVDLGKKRIRYGKIVVVSKSILPALLTPLAHA